MTTTAEFASLTEEVQVERLAQLARRALFSWGIGEARVEPLKYRENAVFSVTTPDGRKLVLRVHRPGYRSDPHIRSEAAWMGALSAAGVPTPTILPTVDGDALVSTTSDGVPEARQCDLQTWVEGTPLGTLEAGVDMDAAGLRRTYATVGELAARIHAHGIKWMQPAGFRRPAWDVDALVGDRPTFGRFGDLDELTSEQREQLLGIRDRVRVRLAALGPPNLLVHGDLIPDNILAAADGVRVIDFDDCGWSWWVFELVTSVFPLIISGGYEDGRDGFLEGYRRVRPAPDDELEFVGPLIVARALSYLGWPAGRVEIHSQRPMASFLAAAVLQLTDRFLE